MLRNGRGAGRARGSNHLLSKEGRGRKEGGEFVASLRPKQKQQLYLACADQQPTKRVRVSTKSHLSSSSVSDNPRPPRSSKGKLPQEEVDDETAVLDRMSRRARRRCMTTNDPIEGKLLGTDR